MASIVGLGSAFPPPLDQDAAWDGFFADHFSDSRVARRVWRAAGVDRRHCAVDPRVEDLSLASTGARMGRFVELAVPLACDAVTRALCDAGVAVGDVGQLTVVSCTGYATPGVDLLVASRLGLPSSVERLSVGHMGCYAAIPAVASTADTSTARGKVGVVVCVELTSLHLQPPTDDPEQIVAHALFSDAAAAAVIVPGDRGGARHRGWEVVDVVARTDRETMDLMTWSVTDVGFRMHLSSKVPSVLDRHVASVAAELLDRHGLQISDVDDWAIHPGGPRIVDTVARRLALTDDDVATSRDVLRQHGNCSSATTLLVLEALTRGPDPAPGRHLVAMAFGPGLTLYTMLLRTC